MSTQPVRSMKRFVNEPLENLLTSFGHWKKLHKRIDITYATRSLVGRLDVTNTVATGICETLNLMVYQAAAACIPQSRNKDSELSFVAPDEKITNSASLNQQSLRSCFVKNKLGSNPSQWNSKVANIKNKSGSSKNWEAMAELFLVKDIVLMKDIIEMFSKRKDLWTGRLRTIKATHYTIDLNEGTHSIFQQPYCAVKRSGEVFRKDIDKQLKTSVIEPAHSELASPIILVPKMDGTFQFHVDHRCLNITIILDTYTLSRMDDCIQKPRKISIVFSIRHPMRILANATQRWEQG